MRERKGALESPEKPVQLRQGCARVGGGGGDQTAKGLARTSSVKPLSHVSVFRML